MKHYFFFQVWSKHRPEIGDFAKPENQQEALACLNELITNALELIPSSLHFMSRLHNQSVFNFVAIPQVGTKKNDQCLQLCGHPFNRKERNSQFFQLCGHSLDTEKKNNETLQFIITCSNNVAVRFHKL